MKTKIYGFKKYTRTKDLLHKYADAFYQKVVTYNKVKIDINIYEYQGRQLGYICVPRTYQTEIQIPEEVNPIKKTINVTLFAYKKLDFEKIEKQARAIIERLIK